MMLETILTAVIASILTTMSGLLLAERRIKREYRLHFQAETVARKLLSDERWNLRTFDTLKRHLGGFEDDALRQILVQAGAIRFEDPNGLEVWGLLERTMPLLSGDAVVLPRGRQ